MQLSESFANWLNGLANWGLVASLVVGVISTMLIVWTGNAKEEFLKEKLADAKKLAAQADLSRVKLQNRMVDIFGPRQLTAQQSTDIGKRLAGLKGTKVDIYVFKLGSPYNSTEFSDDSNLGINLTHVLRAAGLDAEVWLLESCQDSGASNLVVGVVEKILVT